MILWIIVFIISLAILIKSADIFTQKAEKIGVFFGMSPLLIGVTIVAIGTSLPELATGYSAIGKDLSSLVIDNVVGSNIANILLVLGIASIFAKTKLQTKESLVDNQLIMLAIITLLMVAATLDKSLSYVEGSFLIALYAIIVWEALGKKKSITKSSNQKIYILDILLLMVSLVGISFGAKFVIEACINISTILQISPSIVALLAIAIGTSLPEIVVSSVAAYKNKGELAFGNVVGSCFFNLTMITGILSFVTDLQVSEQTFHIGIPALMIATFIYVIIAYKGSLSKYEGAVMLVGYMYFVYILV